jgi:hypothetical protein
MKRDLNQLLDLQKSKTVGSRFKRFLLGRVRMNNKVHHNSLEKKSLKSLFDIWLNGAGQ